MGRFFYHIFKVIEKHKTLTTVLLAGLFGLLFWIGSSISFEEDISKLIPKNSENEQLQKTLNTVNFNDKIIVALHVNSEGSSDDLIEYATAFTDSISENFNTYIEDIQGKIEEEEALEAIDFVYQNLPLFLETEDYKIIDRKLNADSIQAITESNYKTIISPSGIISKSLIAKDPLGLSFLGLQHLNQLGLSEGFILKDGFLLSEDERYLLLFLSPKFGTENTNENGIFYKNLKQLQKNLDEEYSLKVKSSFFGGPLIAVENAEQIKTDIKITLGIALTTLLIVFIFFYRNIATPLILFLPTLFGGVLALAVLALIRSEISAISLGIGAVLLGITLDYSLHILTHIRNNETVETIYKHVSQPIIMSSITTALAFLCLLFIDSQALQDLGVFAACSVIGASVFALIFIPQVYKLKANSAKFKTTLIDRMATLPFHKSKVLIGSIVLLLVISTFTFNTVEFNKDLSQLNYKSDTLKAAEIQLDALTNVSSKSLYVISLDDSLEGALQQNDSVFEILKHLEQNETIINFNSIASLVNSEKKQLEYIYNWNRFWSAEKISGTQDQLINSGNTFGFKPTTHQDFYQLLNKNFKPLPIKAYKNVPTFSAKDFISVNEGLTTVTTIVKLNEENIEAIKDRFKTHENVVVVDRQGLNETLLSDLREEFNTLILYSSIVIFLLLLGFYRNIKLAVVTLLPILLTWFLTLGLMGLFKLQFNIFNIIISTFIFGLGVDYCIFMTNGLKYGRDTILGLATYKTSVILSVITTVLGVGVLVFAKHPALYSIALVSIIGIVSAMLMAFTIQPILYKFLMTTTISDGKN